MDDHTRFQTLLAHGRAERAAGRQDAAEVIFSQAADLADTFQGYQKTVAYQQHLIAHMGPLIDQDAAELQAEYYRALLEERQLSDRLADLTTRCKQEYDAGQVAAARQSLQEVNAMQARYDAARRKVNDLTEWRG